MTPTVNLNTQVLPNLRVSAVEPGAAKGEGCVFYTFNTGGFALSTDGGKTFPASGSPATIFPNTVFDNYYDQSTIWVPQIKKFVWVMLRTPQGSATPHLRFAYTSADSLRNNQGQDWAFIDITAKKLGFQGKFDYPQLAVGEKFVYVTVQLGNAELVDVTGAAILRFKISDLTDGASTVAFSFWSTQNSSNFGMAQNCGSRAYWASHENMTNLLRLYWWDESSSELHWRDVGIPDWNSANYTSLTPTGQDWLDHEWCRITGARVAASELVFAWTAGTDDNQEQPYIYLAAIGQDLKTDEISLTGQVDWALPLAACAFGALGSDPQSLSNNVPGCLALSYGWGGGGVFFANHAVAFIQLPLTNVSVSESVSVAASSFGAARWGDYLTLRNDDFTSSIYLTAGYLVSLSPTGPQSAMYYVAFSPGEFANLGSGLSILPVPGFNTSG